MSAHTLTLQLGSPKLLAVLLTSCTVYIALTAVFDLQCPVAAHYWSEGTCLAIL